MRIARGICPIGDHPFEYEPKPGQQRVYCSDQHQILAASNRAIAKRALQTIRYCYRCKEEKPSGEFPGPSTGLCRPCHAAYARERRRINGIDPAYTRIMNLRRYGLTLETFAAMLAAQGGRCAVCLTSEPGGQGWHVDHDHACCNTRKRSCGKCTRGILCTRCNIGIGNFKDDPVIIQAAIDYITAYRARREVSGPAA
jgi:hypothetical protein